MASVIKNINICNFQGSFEPIFLRLVFHSLLDTISVFICVAPFSWAPDTDSQIRSFRASFSAPQKYLLVEACPKRKCLLRSRSLFLGMLHYITFPLIGHTTRAERKAGPWFLFLPYQNTLKEHFLFWSFFLSPYNKYCFCLYSFFRLCSMPYKFIHAIHFRYRCDTLPCFDDNVSNPIFLLHPILSGTFFLHAHKLNCICFALPSFPGSIR